MLFGECRAETGEACCEACLVEGEDIGVALDENCRCFLCGAGSVADAREVVEILPFGEEGGLRRVEVFGRGEVCFAVRGCLCCAPLLLQACVEESSSESDGARLCVVDGKKDARAKPCAQLWFLRALSFDDESRLDEVFLGAVVRFHRFEEGLGVAIRPSERESFGACSVESALFEVTPRCCALGMQRGRGGRRLRRRRSFLEFAQQAGVALKRKPETPKTQQRRQHWERIRETIACAEAFYRRALFASEGAAARRYLKQRGLDRACAERFALGWADSNTKPFFEAMKSDNRSEKDLVEAGLVVERQSSEKPQLRARFRSRILFPIDDAQARTIAFGGRFLDTSLKQERRTTQATSNGKADFTPPKYLNSPETALFAKGQNLYNFARVRNAPRTAQKTPTVLVEGYTDVLALDKTGFATSLASLGTALSEQQLLLLWQCAETPVLCFDGDKAGALAAKRAVLRALPLLDETRNLRLFFLPEGHDPDSFVAAFGIEKWREALLKTEAVSAFLWRDEKNARSPLQTPEQLAALEKTLSEHANAVKAPLLAKHYRAFFKDALFAERRRQNKRDPIAQEFMPFSNDEQKQLRHLQERLLAVLASRPQLWDAYEERFARTALPHDLDAARQAMLLAYEDAPDNANLTQILWQSAGEVLQNIARSPDFFAQNPYLASPSAHRAGSRKCRKNLSRPRILRHAKRFETRQHRARTTQKPCPHRSQSNLPRKDASRPLISLTSFLTHASSSV